MRNILLAMAATGLVLGGCAGDTNVKTGGQAQQARAQAKKAAPASVPANAREWTTSDGLKIEDIKIGGGALAEKGKDVMVHYTGRLEDGTQFDSSYTRGQPFSFPLGGGRVIRGWDEGLVGMKEGGKRVLTIPSHMGYGAAGAGKVIPPNATLVFDVELISVK